MLECYVESPLRSGWPADDESNGIITIPETITYNTRKYVVTQIKTESFLYAERCHGSKDSGYRKSNRHECVPGIRNHHDYPPDILTRIDNNAFRRCSSPENNDSTGAGTHLP